jgi:hypothetical protein
MTKRVTITVEECPLPSTVHERDVVCNDFKTAVRTAIPAADDQPPTEITVRMSYHYAQVDTACPQCHEPLVVDRIRLTKANDGAHADVWCPTCEYSGTAVFRAVDYEGGLGHGHESAVLTGALTPSYEPY